MRKATLSIFGILAMTIGLWATVPYTFTAKTPAKASEVNSNFQSLSDKITTLEGNVSNIVSGGSDGSNCYASPYTYNYSYVPSNIGDTITLSGEEYIMVAMPFIEFSTGDHYYVKYPAKKQLSSLGMSLSASIGTSYVKAGNECFLYTFAGFPANAYPSIGYYNNYSATMSDFAGVSSYMISRSVYSNVSVKINQTILNFIMYLHNNNNIQYTLLSSGDVDMRDDINWAEMYNDTSLVDDMKTLLNYIEIVKIP